MKKRVLTGITPSGTLHLGNYVGALRPCIRQSEQPDVDSFFFLSDLHALIKCQDPERLERSRLQIAATWLAAGLDPEKVTFYRQSDVPETTMLAWLLTCSCSKGLMNRAHAYKAVVEASEAAGEDPDAKATMGLFCYPILMAADILIFNADLVPVGKDQIQHLEMARDIATRFNNTYAPADKPFFRMPYALVDETLELLPGTDGRKMSKSYDNVIPLFEGGSKALKEMVNRIVTDDKKPGEAKDPDSTSLTQLFKAFSTPEQYQAFRTELVDGLGWGEAKAKLFNQIEAEIGPMRPKYERFISNPSELEEILRMGGEKARKLAAPFVDELVRATGLRPFTEFKGEVHTDAKPAAKKKPASLKQYREKDGTFGFKLTAGNGAVLFESAGWASGAEAGRTIGRIKKEGFAALASVPGIKVTEGVTQQQIEEALASLG